VIIRWLDTTPISRVLTRCTEDIRTSEQVIDRGIGPLTIGFSVDGPLPQSLRWLVDQTMAMVVKFIAVVLLTPAFLLPGASVAAAGGYYGQLYKQAQLAVKREMSNAKQPVLGQ
jgi:hypothetical protein